MDFQRVVDDTSTARLQIQRLTPTTEFLGLQSPLLALDTNRYFLLAAGEESAIVEPASTFLSIKKDWLALSHIVD